MKVLNIGYTRDLKKKIDLPIEALTKHFVALGQSGSGKTYLNKVLIEELSLNNIPVIVLDSQGDMASLAIDKKNKLNSKTLIFTPGSNVGIPVSISPLDFPDNLDEEEKINLMHYVSSNIVELCGYDLESDSGKGAEILLYSIFEKTNKIKDFDMLASLIRDPPIGINNKIKDLISETEVLKLIKKIRFLSMGQKQLLFTVGSPLNIKNMIKPGQISVIYLNTLKDQEDKDFFVSMLSYQIYHWMMKNPSSKLQLGYSIDEIAPYLPAGQRKPISKPILELLFKQARKFGVGIIASTQNPGDIDYKALSQVSTWAIGRMVVLQDINKIKDFLNSTSVNLEIFKELNNFKAGEFVFISPDNFKQLEIIKSREIFTEHKTLNDSDIRELVKKEDIIKHKAVQKTSELHFPINIDHKEIKEIFESKTKKIFGIIKMGEKYNSHELIMWPFYNFTVQSIKKSIFKVEILRYNVFVDSMNGKVIVFNKNNLEIVDELKNYLKLNEESIKLLKIFNNYQRRLTLDEITKNLNIEKNETIKLLKNLKKEKIVKELIDPHHSALYEIINKINIPSNIKNLNSEDIKFDNQIVSANFINPELKPDLIKNFLMNFYDCKILKQNLVYYPIYEATYKSKFNERVLRISANNKKEINQL